MQDDGEDEVRQIRALKVPCHACERELVLC